MNEILKVESMIFTFGDEVTTLINSYSKLKDGWDYGIGSRISSHVIIRALKAYNMLYDPLFDYEVTPFSNDSIKITFSLEDNFLDIITSKSSYEVIKEKGVGYDFTSEYIGSNVSLSKIQVLLKAIKQKCYTSELLTLTNTVELKSASTAVYQEWEMAFPYLTLSAQSVPLVQFATI